MSDNIADHNNNNNNNKREGERKRQTRIERRIYKHTISYTIAEHWERYSDKKREINTDHETYIYTYNEW